MLCVPLRLPLRPSAFTKNKLFTSQHNSRVRQISTICLLTAFMQSDAPYKTCVSPTKHKLFTSQIIQLS